MTPDQHTVTLYHSRSGAWAVCACGWQSVTHVSKFLAQRAWAAHVTAVLLNRSDTANFT